MRLDNADRSDQWEVVAALSLSDLDIGILPDPALGADCVVSGKSRYPRDGVGLGFRPA